MSEILFTLAQFVFILWPLFIITALVYSFQGRLSWRALSRRVLQSLMVTWSVLFLVWLVTLLAPLATPSLIPEPWNTIIFLTGFGLLLLAEASRLGLLRRRLHARANLHHTSSLQHLKDMDPNDFEYLVAETYRTLGYQATHVGHSGDHGVDVLLRAPNGEHWVVQCKRYHGTVGESIVRDLYGTMVSEKANRAVLVTTAHITPPAEEWASGKPIELIDGQGLLQLIGEAHRRTQGSPFDRLVNWLDRVIESIFHAPAQSAPSGVQISMDATQPVRVRPAGPDTAPTEIGPAVTVRTAALAGTTAASASASGATAPTHVRRHNLAPICPNCGLAMVPRPPRPSDPPGRVLYRCRNYPTCRVVLEPQNNSRGTG